MRPYIAERKGSEQSVAKRMDSNIGVAMAQKTMAVGYQHAADP